MGSGSGSSARPPQKFFRRLISVALRRSTGLGPEIENLSHSDNYARCRACGPLPSDLNIKPNIHNAVMIIAFAVLGILLLRLAAGTALGSVPVVGQVLKTASSA